MQSRTRTLAAARRRASAATANTASRPPRVYTYSRFSSAQQADGSSVERQDAYAEAWAAKHGLVLDRSLRMHDAAKSAFHGANVQKGGALHAFLLAIEQGIVQEGDTLLVENLDRLSRGETLEAKQLFLDIVHNGGVTIVTTNEPPQVYNREEFRKNKALIFVVDALFMRANEESDSKSVRARGAYRAKCKGWQDGSYRGLVGAPRAISSKGTIANGTDPEWVLYNRDTKKFDVVEPAATAVRRVIALYREGYGSMEIARRVRDEGLELSEAWAVSRVQRIIASPALVGTKVVMADGERFELPGYYPPLLKPEQFDALQLLVSKRGIRKGKGEIPALVTGTKLSFCGFCRSPLVTQNVSTTRANGEQYIKRRLRCSHAYSKGVKCEGNVDSCNAEVVENAIFDFVGDQANLDHLLRVDESENPHAAELAAARAQLVSLELELQDHKANITAYREKHRKAAPLSLVEVMGETEAAMNSTASRIAALEREAGVQAHRKPSTSRQWAKLRKAALALDSEARMQVRKMIVDTFKRIDVFLRNREDRTHLLIVLTGKGGVERRLVVHRRSGEVRGVTEIDRDADTVTRKVSVNGQTFTSVSKGRAARKEAAA
jgi:DNA invertase Pin-like site-specific DNA recombinase